MDNKEEKKLGSKLLEKRIEINTNEIQLTELENRIREKHIFEKKDLELRQEEERQQLYSIKSQLNELMRKFIL